MSSLDQPPVSAAPELSNPVKESSISQNVTAKANQDSQSKNQEIAVQEAAGQEAGVEKQTEAKEAVALAMDGTGDEATSNPQVSAINDEEQTSSIAAESQNEERKQKVTGMQRLKTGLAKISKGGHRVGAESHSNSDHAAQTSADTITEVVAAPDASVREGEGVDTAGGIRVGAGVEGEATTNAHGDESATDEAVEDDGDTIPDDPISLADIIRNLVKALPQPTEPIPVPSKPKLPQLDLSGKPIPPQGAVLTDNKKLVAKLRNPDVMNGTTYDVPEGEESSTVFAILDSFKAPSSDNPASREGSDATDGDGETDDGENSDDNEGSDGEDERPHIIADDSSVMVYIPLVPTKKSKVEMAKYQVVPINSQLKQTITESTGADESRFVEMLTTYRAYGTFGRGTVPPMITGDGAPVGKLKEAISWPKPLWKLWPWKKKVSAATPTSQPPASTPDADNKPPEPGAGDADKKPADSDKAKKPRKLKKPKPSLEQRVWIPSNTQISVQALWWGYRIFLPPPVLALLSDKTIEAAKRATMITNALTWFFAHLPLTMFPAPMQPALLLLQQIVPYVGYVGTFVTWSWSTIKSYDVGYGVILSATWILPVALIPGTWQAYDFPANPPTTNPSQPSTGTPVITQPPTSGTPTQPSTGTPPPKGPVGTGPKLPPAATEPIVPPEVTVSDKSDWTKTQRLRIVKGNESAAVKDPNALPPTVSKRLVLVKGQVEPVLSPNDVSERLAVVKGQGDVDVDASTTTELPPTVSKRLVMVKGQVVPVMSTEDDVVAELPPTVSKRLALVKGKTEKGEEGTEEKEGEEPAKKATGGIWKYLKG
ncbi:hypothetical protein L218DRAFT_901306 [Marasmius fiardii PR-910]|nr:hypothetical protein L218DRAFT_901306 [Marasmius fiardii PR-910]